MLRLKKNCTSWTHFIELSTNKDKRWSNELTPLLLSVIVYIKLITRRKRKLLALFFEVSNLGRSLIIIIEGSLLNA
jgi:hypothetical protein